MNGEQMMALIEELYPLCRSLTGDGVRETLRRIGARIGPDVPLEVHEVPSGTPALDWEVPDEWNIRAASIRTPDGKTIVDLADSSLHVVGYSEPVEGRFSKEELDPHLHSLPEQPSAIPWRTAYYERNWGFCLSQETRDAMGPGPFDVSIESTLAPGHLTYGEIAIPGQTENEFLVSVHVCHPSLVNDNLSGIAVASALAALYGAPAETKRARLGLRILFIPGTIGSLTWLSRNRERLARIRGGLTLTCLGDAAPLTYKRTFDGDHAIDRIALRALEGARTSPRVLDFYPYGYDERQYNSPGFRMPIGSLMRSRHGRFPEYHTSLDSPEFVSGDQLEEALGVVRTIFDMSSRDRVYRESGSGRRTPTRQARHLPSDGRRR